MNRKRTVLFLQLPALDNDVGGPRENIPLAGLCLRQALERSAESRHFEAEFLPAGADGLDNAGVVRLIAERRPAVLACTLYLWNVERTLRVVAAVRKMLPDVGVAAGGPEAAFRHPFLYRSAWANAIVVGEGEPVFAAVLRALRGGAPPDFRTVAWRRGRRYAWGRRTPAPAGPRDFVPATGPAGINPDANGLGYLETTRGCPLRCTFCRYHHFRRGVAALPPDEVIRRARQLAERGAKEIKFADPTFNAHPRLAEILLGLARLNRRRRLKFLAEVRADTLTDAQAALLAAANFTEIEIGLQSRDPAVLRTIRRPTDLAALERGVRALTRRGIRVTLDVMYGLPHQRCRDVLAAVGWGRRRRGVRVQCLPTLLLPGTDLRERAAQWGLVAPPRPPYGVLSTPTLSRDAMLRIEAFLSATPGLPADSPTARFVGNVLPGLFVERHAIVLPRAADRAGVPGTANRRTLMLRGSDLFACRREIRGILRRVVNREPDCLWQFVLCPEREEPLDTLDLMLRELRRAPAHWLDRSAGPRLSGRMAARRIMVLLRRGQRYDRAWRRAAESFLRRSFY